MKIIIFTLLTVTFCNAQNFELKPLPKIKLDSLTSNSHKFPLLYSNNLQNPISLEYYLLIKKPEMNCIEMPKHEIPNQIDYKLLVKKEEEIDILFQ